jgi:membrane associated rhomboid family serine protease
MPAFTKATWTNTKGEIEPLQKQTTSCVKSTIPDSSDLSSTYIVNEDIQIDIDRQDQTIYITPSSIESYCPTFTIGVGVFDVFMLIVIYFVQGETVLTSDTWIKLGGKYVPCMKPLYSRAEQDIYNADLRSQCQPFLFPYQFYRFFTPMFLHSGITHLLSNLVYQALAGSLLEGKYGTRTFGICYILFGFSGNIMSALSNPQSSK